MNYRIFMQGNHDYPCKSFTKCNFYAKEKTFPEYFYSKKNTFSEYFKVKEVGSKIIHMTINDETFFPTMQKVKNNGLI